MTPIPKRGIPETAEAVVVGAGLAGLATAVTLARAGVDLHVLEARERVGGRVLTLRAPFEDGLYAEAGGEFVGPAHRVLRDFLRAYGLGLHRLPAAPRRLYLAGRTVEGRELADLDDETSESARRLGQGTAELSARVEVPARPWASTTAAELDARSLGEWLDGLRLHPLARAHAQAWTTVDYGVEPESISLLQYARDERLLQRSPDGPNERVRGGMDQLPAAMAAELGPRVQLGAVATRLEQDARSATVRYRRDGLPGQIRADYVVVALPYSALRSLEVNPPFDAGRREAIAGLRYSPVAKLFFRVRRRFWRYQGAPSGTLADDPAQGTYDATYGQPGEGGILTIYAGGRTAAELAGLTEEEQLARGRAYLEGIYPGCGADLERGHAVVWSADPASLGAYSYFGPGELTRYGPLLARPEGRIHFAGEHTDPWQATMNGALASGVRAAEEIRARRKA